MKGRIRVSGAGLGVSWTSMGDGGVACVAAQNVMEQFSESVCGGGKNGKFGSKAVKKMKMKAKREEFLKKTDDNKIECSADSKVPREEVEEGEHGKLGSKLANKMKMKVKREEFPKKIDGKAEFCAENKVLKEEIEEGELGTLRWPINKEVENGEFVPGKVIKSEIERGGSPGERWARWEPEKEDFVPAKWRKQYGDRGDFSSGRDRYRKREPMKAEYGSWRGPKPDIEKGEFVPERWHKNEVVVKEKIRWDDVIRDDDWDCEREMTPPCKYMAQKDFSRSVGPFSKRSAKWEASQKRNPRLGSKIVVEDNSLNNNTQHSNGKSHLKRPSKDFDSSDRKPYGAYNDYTSSKIRRISDDGNRSSYMEHHTRHFSRNNNVPSDRYSSRHFESPPPSRVPYEKHERSPRHYEWSPRRSELSPRDWDRYTDRKDRSPSIRRNRSPPDRNRYYDYRDRSPSYSEWSPNDRGRHRDQRDRTPEEPSFIARGRHNKKMGRNEKQQSNYGGKKKEDKADKKDHVSAKESRERSNPQRESEHVEKKSDKKPPLEEQSQNVVEGSKECPQAEGAAEELLSMEEDMDICDTPPHVPAVIDSASGKWVYLDHFGVERGPTKLGDLKTLVEEGYLVSDHLIRHLDGDRWVTVEKAASPLVNRSLPSVITSDSITQLVSPPQAPGNLLVDVGDSVHCANKQLGLGDEKSTFSPEQKLCLDKVSAMPESIEDFCIDDRVDTLLAGYNVIPGQELETVVEALRVKFGDEEGQISEDSEGLLWYWFPNEDEHNQSTGSVLPPHPEVEMIEATGDPSAAFAFYDTGDLLSGRWSCKGGDWKRIDESAQDGYWRKKFVLNDGYPLCQMVNYGYEDPRWLLKDEMYQPSHNRRLDLPPWAFSLADEGNDCGSGSSRSNQIKPVVGKGIKGSVLPVVRINACVVKDQGSFVSELRTKVRGKDRHTSRSSRAYSGASDVKRSSEERGRQLANFHEQESRGSARSTTHINIPKDRLCTMDDLQLHLGDWYYLDGAGHEQGPFSFSELQILAGQDVILKNSSVFRKQDKLWVPLSNVASSRAVITTEQEIDKRNSGLEPAGDMHGRNSSTPALFNSIYPQFIGFTRGKLHELVMKSYKSREFAAAINEVLDPWINAKQPKKETEKYIPNSSLYNHYRSSDKRVRLLLDGSLEDCEMEEELVAKEEIAFDDLRGNAIFQRVDKSVSEIEFGRWGILDGHVLARIFHFLRTDLKSLVYAALTCKHWRAVSTFYKDISRQVDLSSLGLSCTDSMFLNVMTGYRKEKIMSLVLFGCTNISSVMLERIIQSFPSLSSLDIRGCSQLGDLADKFPSINWIKSRGLQTRSLKNVNERNWSLFRTNGANMDDSSGLKDYFESVERRDANQSFHKSLYKRSKLFDAKRSSSIISREARLRRWALKKSENSYRKMEEFLTVGIKDIMRENSFDFFVPKVAEIEDRMKNGYYSARGLSSVKEDISRMCRDAIKAKSRGDGGDINRIVTLFIQLATRLDDSCKNSYEKLMKNWKDDSSVNFLSGSSKYKKCSKGPEKRTVRCNGTHFLNGNSDYGDYATDREIRKRLSKLNKKTMDSGSETSDELDKSSEETETDSESSVSDSDRDSDSQSGSAFADSRGDGSYITEDGFDSMNDEREWGARMTKASLVPPVTRKYDVIDKYAIVADEDEVKRKMEVSLPDDYAEKLIAQKNGTEESDMEIPEVKDYKPRKQLGVEVLEQEVYGVDPYTHNLLLDSVPDGVDWTLQDKHIFIEDVLLRTLNKQVRHFTGSGNTPMMYPLRPVIEEIFNTAELDHEVRIIQFCKSILKAIDSRPEDSYVAYRKGLGVVCNKEGGFGQEDFIVEFLGEVYPAWKWFEKQDGVRFFQKDSKDAPEFYNIYLERPKGDADGYDIVVVDAMHKANYASRICHSCRPNCEAKVTAVDGQYQIGIYAVRPIEYGEEITFDYNSVTESKEEYEASVCLCGSQVCRGSYLNLTGEGAYQKVLKDWHGILDRYQMLLEACELNFVSDEDYIDLGRAGLGSCLLAGLPDWLIAYTARLVRFINFERTKLPQEILRHNLEEKRKYFVNISIDDENNDAEIQAEGVYNQRLQNLALTLDKVRYVMRRVYDDPKEAPPPLERLSPQETVSLIWKGEGSFVDELIRCIAPYTDDSMLKDLKSKIRAHDPSGADDIQKELQKSLRWLRDEVRDLPCTYKCRHDAAADLIHIYAYTKFYFRVREYEMVTSPPVYISPLDLGPKFADKLAPGLHEYCKTYSENYCLGQLIFWHNQADADPDCNLAKASKGCVQLPEIGSFYAKVQKPSRQRVYGPRTLKLMLARMEKHPQKPWPSDRIWSFKDFPKFFGSPMLDSVLDNSPLDKEMVHWLKHRPAIFQANWDR